MFARQWTFRPRRLSSGFVYAGSLVCQICLVRTVISRRIQIWLDERSSEVFISSSNNIAALNTLYLNNRDNYRHYQRGWDLVHLEATYNRQQQKSTTLYHISHFVGLPPDELQTNHNHTRHSPMLENTYAHVYILVHRFSSKRRSSQSSTGSISPVELQQLRPSQLQ